MSYMMFPSLFAAVDNVADAGMGTVKMEPLDLTIIVFYLVAIVALGCWAGLRKKRDAKGSDYFLAGRSLRWPLIGLALFATNISTIHLVSLAESGYCSGLLYGDFEWMAPFTLVLLALFFAPFYIRSSVATLPDFLEKRYNRGCRDLLAVLSIFSAVVVHIGFSLYTGAVVLEGTVLGAFVEHPEQYRVWTIIIICGATALYTIIGGLMAVVVTESIQTIVLLIGAICITVLGLNMIGGWEALKAQVHPVNFSVCRPDSDPTGLSWYAVFTGYWITGIWYWCTDQTIVQRVLGAKDENHARIGPLFAGFIKILPVFIFVLPGLICLGLIDGGFIPPLPLAEDGTPKAGETYAHLIRWVLPIGARGIVIAALLAALMSTVSGALNSIATLFSYDIYKRWVPDASDRNLIRVGRVATFAAMIVAIIWSLVVGGLGKTIFQAMVDVFCTVAPPTTVVFFWGVFWKRASAKAALITMIVGIVLGGAVSAISLLGLNKIGDYEIHSLLSCFLLAVFESILLIVLSFIFPQKHTQESASLVWKSPLEALRGKPSHWLLNYRVWAAALLVTMVGLYIMYAGDTNYYSVQGQITMAGKPVIGAEVHFVCDDKTFQFTDVTDAEGKYRYGTKRAAGGAPEGTRYRVAVAASKKLIVLMKEVPLSEGSKETKTVVDKILYRVPVEMPIQRKPEKDGGESLHFKVAVKRRIQEKEGATVKSVIKEVIEDKVIKVAKGQNVQIWEPTPLPARYAKPDTSGLTCTIEGLPMFTIDRPRYNFELEN